MCLCRCTAQGSVIPEGICVVPNSQEHHEDWPNRLQPDGPSKWTHCAHSGTLPPRQRNAHAAHAMTHATIRCIVSGLAMTRDPDLLLVFRGAGPQAGAPQHGRAPTPPPAHAHAQHCLGPVSSSGCSTSGSSPLSLRFSCGLYYSLVSLVGPPIFFASLSLCLMHRVVFWFCAMRPK